MRFQWLNGLEFILMMLNKYKLTYKLLLLSCKLQLANGLVGAKTKPQHHYLSVIGLLGLRII